MGVLDNFFATGTYTGISTSVSSLKHVLKSTTKKKKKTNQRLTKVPFTKYLQDFCNRKGS